MDESPFLPDGRRWLWSANSLELAQACDRKYYYASKLNLVGRDQSDNITFGAHYSAACERYHRLMAHGAIHHEAVRAVTRAALEDSKGWESRNHAKTRETLIRSIIWYFDQFENDPCKTIILADGQPAAELEFRFQLTDEIWLRGKIDRLVEYAGEAYCQDQKTTGATIGSYYFKRYNPNIQMSLYTVATQVVWATPVKGVMIDAAQIAVGFTRFERGFTFRTQEQNEEWLQATKYHIQRNWEAAERGWPQNNAACMMYGGCQFRDVCSKSPQVRDEFLATGFETRQMEGR